MGGVLLAGLATVWSRIWPWVIAAGGVVVAVVTFGASLRRVGRAEAMAEVQKQTLEVVDAERIAASRAPGDRPELVGRLRDGGF